MRISGWWRQRGFLYLTTGANGVGKTAFTIYDVRKLQEETGRPVFYKGFDAGDTLINDFGWREFEPEKWQELPDGAILLFDECQDELPTRGRSEPQEWIKAIARDQRKRGFDFFLISQHPMNIDPFVRRIVASPGWHRHFKQGLSKDVINELRWGQVNSQPEKPGSGKSGDIRQRKLPVEVFDWYRSMSVDTKRFKVPGFVKRFWIAVAALVLVVIVAVVVLRWQFFGGGVSKFSGQDVQTAQPAGSDRIAGPMGTPRVRENKPEGPRTLQDWATHYRPVVAGMPWTAPRYAEMSGPKDLPRIAGCVANAADCRCYTQQGTRVEIVGATCRDMAANPYFEDLIAPSGVGLVLGDG